MSGSTGEHAHSTTVEAAAVASTAAGEGIAQAQARESTERRPMGGRTGHEETPHVSS